MEGLLEGWLVNELIMHGVNFNDLKPYDKVDDNNKEPKKKECNDEFKAAAEDIMRRLGLSVQELKKGTFYDVLENDGRDLDGNKVTKEEAKSIIDRYNNYYKNLHYYSVDGDDRFFPPPVVDADSQQQPLRLEYPCEDKEQKKKNYPDLEFHEFLVRLGFPYEDKEEKNKNVVDHPIPDDPVKYEARRESILRSYIKHLNQLGHGNIFFYCNPND